MVKNIKLDKEIYDVKNQHKQLKETIKQLKKSHTWKGEEETNYQS